MGIFFAKNGGKYKKILDFCKKLCYNIWVCKIHTYSDFADVAHFAGVSVKNDGYGGNKKQGGIGNDCRFCFL